MSDQLVQSTPPSFSNLTEMTADAIFCLAWPSYNIEYVNQAASSIFGYHGDELVGQSFKQLYPSPTNFEVFTRKQIAAIALHQTQMRVEQLLRHKNGSILWTENHLTIVYEKDVPLRLICSVRDITQRSLLLSTVAHELRAPLSILTGLSGVLADDNHGLDTANQTRYLNILNQTATDMGTMLDKLLDVTAFELGKVMLEIEPVEIAALLQEQIRQYTPRAERKQIQLIETSNFGDTVCYCDRIRIRQVISNFLENAIKYSPADTTIELMGKEQDNLIWIGIQDQGPGIPKEEQQYLFQHLGYSKISSKPTGGEKSSGLGLVICKKIIDAHGGTISIDSAEKQGTTFWFTLPK